MTRCTIGYCANEAEPERITPTVSRDLPDDWLQVQVVDHLGATRNFILCPVHKGAFSPRELVGRGKPLDLERLDRVT